jgi:RluA family pseudouridine synthase
MTGTDVPLSRELAGYSVIEYLGVLYPAWSLHALEGLFAAGRVQSGGRPVAAERLVGELADLSIAGGTADVPSIWAPGGDCGVRVLDEDARLIALAKPSGVPVVPDRTRSGQSCLGFLLARELAARAPGPGRKAKPLAEYVRPRIVHRIDRLTSGLVLVAKTPEAERELARGFEKRRVRKEYVALLLGEVLAARVTVVCPIAPGRKGRMRVDPAGKPAETAFEVVERFPDFTLVRARPVTGRTHQIRVHALAIGHPLAVDPLYRLRAFAQRPWPPAIKRLTLHASAYTLPESWSGRRLYECELPDDFRAALAALRAERGAEGRA